MRKHQKLLLALLALVTISTGVAAQQTGTITGQVTDQTTQQPLVGAEVIVVGTQARGVTDQQGNYRIAGIAAGQRQVSATRIGYTTQSRPVTVVAGQTATANFTLTTSVVELGGLIVTATGQQQRQREIGSAVGVVDVASVPLAPINNMSQLLQGRVSGVTVMQSSGTTGSGARVRIRGNNSMSLSNAPLIVIDGVRSENAESGVAGTIGFGVGGQEPSRLNDINPEDIETIEVLKGPAAAALYGTAAANGVIQITTKRGRAGRPEVRVWSEYGWLGQTTEFPVNTYAEGTLVNRNGPLTGANAIGRCDIARQAIGSNPTGNQIGCTGVTNTYTHSPLANAETSPFQDGNRNTIGGSVSGGSEAATYYFSADVENEQGVLPQNYLRRIKVQANSTGRIGENLNIRANVGYLTNRAEYPNSDNALYGIVPMGLYGNPRPQFVESQQGFRSDPAFFYDWKTFQRYGRFTGSLQGDYRPISWLNLNGTVGLDRYAREDLNRIPRTSAYAVFGSFWTNGWIQNYTHDIYNLTSNGSATATFNLGEDLVSTTAVGTQFIRENFHRIYAFGATLTPGVEESLAGASTNFSAGEANILNATISGYLQQQFAWRDRVFVNAAVRGDQNTAFGTNIGWIWYPSVSGSWVVSEEPFFPQVDFLSTLRLRAAYGQSGLRPGPSDALQAYTSVATTFAGADVPGITLPTLATSVLGNPDLRPERSSEWEMGLESAFLDERIGLELTYFNKTSTDALVQRQLAPSLGATPFRFENLGEVANSGLEVALRADLVRTPNLNWDARLSGSAIRNELVFLGRDAQGEPLPDITMGFGALQQRHREGFPLGSYFHFPITGFADTDGSGRISPNEVTVRTDTMVYLGNPFPKREASFSTNLSFRDWFKIATLLDYKGGHQLFNLTAFNRCGTTTANCAELYDTSLPLERQAEIVARLESNAAAGFVEDADFVKLREVSVTFGLPREFAERFNTKGLNVTLAGRNLKTWTGYTGLDPELNSQGQTNFTTVEGGTLPPNRVFSVRVDANF